MIPLKTAFVGNGNVARTLAPALSALPSVNLRWIVARSGLDVPVADAVTILHSAREIPRDADLIVISVKDDAVNAVIEEVGERDAIIAHTSGSVSLPERDTELTRYGVFYPLQTFSRTKIANLTDVPFLIEGSAPQVVEVLADIARALGGRPVAADSALRGRVHLAAVFACNFVNSMLATAEDVLAADGLDLRLLRPLLRETLNKAMTCGAAVSQTGPARRGDVGIEHAHMRMLEGSPAAVYKLITRTIAERYEQNSI